MTEEQVQEIERVDAGWRRRALVTGGLLGGLTGVALAYLLIQRAERQGGEVNLSTGEGLRLGLMVLGMLRQVADLASPDDS